MKYVSILSVTLKSAMTASFIGLMAPTLPGVRPNMSFASRPTATTSPLFLLMATMEGSFTTMPLPPENTSVLAVPKSIARSDENKLNTDLRLYPFLFIPQSPRRSVLSSPTRRPQALKIHHAPIAKAGQHLQSPASFLGLGPDRELAIKSFPSTAYFGTTIDVCCFAVPPRRF